MLESGNFCLVAFYAELWARSGWTSLDEFAKRIRSSYEEKPIWEPYMAFLAAARLGARFPKSAFDTMELDLQELLEASLISPVMDDESAENGLLKIHSAIAFELHVQLRSLVGSAAAVVEPQVARDVANAIRLIGCDRNAAAFLPDVIRIVFKSRARKYLAKTEHNPSTGSRASLSAACLAKEIQTQLLTHWVMLPSCSLHELVSHAGPEAVSEINWTQWETAQLNPEWHGTWLRVLIQLRAVGWPIDRLRAAVGDWLRVQDVRRTYEVYPYLLCDALRIQVEAEAQAKAWVEQYGMQSKDDTQEIHPRATLVLNALASRELEHEWIIKQIWRLSSGTVPGAFELKLWEVAKQVRVPRCEIAKSLFLRASQHPLRALRDLLFCHMIAEKYIDCIKDTDWQSLEEKEEWLRGWKGVEKALSASGAGDVSEALLPESLWWKSAERWLGPEDGSGSNFASFAAPIVFHTCCHVATKFANPRQPLMQIMKVRSEQWLSDECRASSAVAGLVHEARINAAVRLRAGGHLEDLDFESVVSKSLSWMEQANLAEPGTHHRVGVLVQRVGFLLKKHSSPSAEMVRALAEHAKRFQDASPSDRRVCGILAHVFDLYMLLEDRQAARDLEERLSQALRTSEERDALSHLPEPKERKKQRRDGQTAARESLETLKLL